EGRNAGGEPADRVLTVGGVIDRRRATGGGEEAKLVQGDAVEEGKEDLAEVAVGQRVPELAPGARRRSEGHLAPRPPHRRGAWSSGCFHRVLSMEMGLGRLGSIESSDDRASSGRWLSGRKHPPAKRVGGVKLPRGFESLPSRSSMCSAQHLARRRAVVAADLQCLTRQTRRP